jgi:hypothetical protein
MALHQTKKFEKDNRYTFFKLSRFCVLHHYSNLLPMNAYEGLVNFSSVKSKKELWSILKNLEGEWWLRIDKTPRSKSANNYYHLILSLLADHTGYTHLETHEEMKRLFLPKFVRKRGKEFEVTSTSDLNGRQFNEFVDRVKWFAADYFHLELPDPKKVYDYR